MHVEEKKDLSLYYWLVGLFSATPKIHIEDGFPTKSLAIPTVSIDRKSIYSRPFELGNRKGNWIPFWHIDIFAENKTQRDGLGFIIMDALENGVPVYDYDFGFPPTTIPQIGVLVPEEMKYQKIEIIPDLVDTLYWRAQITFTSSYEEI
jgi:hypothetical protein